MNLSTDLQHLVEYMIVDRITKQKWIIKWWIASLLYICIQTRKKM